jgi:hypothetical protein
VSKDLSKILADWDFDPDKVTVRSLRGDDGREKLQLRIDLGVLQMEVDGRPDGLRPEGCESYLEYYEREAAADGASGSGSYQIDDLACRRLLREGLQYYHRYLCFWNLCRYAECARDTARNLRLFAFVRQAAPSDEDRKAFDQWRPYVTMMNARAIAVPLLEVCEFSEALAAVDGGIKGIRQFLKEYRQLDRADDCEELKYLLRFKDEIEQRQSSLGEKGPGDSRAVLEYRLRQAVAGERFEEAARLRDEIRRLDPEARPPAR